MKEPILIKNRQVKHCPPHFTKVTITPAKVERGLSMLEELPPIEAEARDWLHTNIEGRFFIGQVSELGKGFAVDALIAGFEDPMEATYFSLAFQGLIEK